MMRLQGYCQHRGCGAGLDSAPGLRNTFPGLSSVLTKITNTALSLCCLNCASDSQALNRRNLQQSYGVAPRTTSAAPAASHATVCEPRSPLIHVDKFPIHGKAGHELSWPHFDLAALRRDGVWMQPSHGYQAGKRTTVFLTVPLLLHTNNTWGPASQVSGAMDGIEFSVV